MLNPQQIAEYRKAYDINTSGSGPTNTGAAAPHLSFKEKIKSLVTGGAKEVADSTIQTTRGLQMLGQGAIAAIDPTRNFQEVRNQTGFKSLQGDQAIQIDETLESKNQYESAGKGLALVGGLLLPGGSRKVVASGAKKVGGIAKGAAESAAGTGKQLAKKTIEKASDTVTQIETPTESMLNPSRLIPKDKLKNIPTADLVEQGKQKSQKFESYISQAKKAMKDYGQKTPLVQAGERGSEALNIVGQKLAKQGQLKKEALGKVGDVQVKNIGAFRAKLRDELRDRVGVNIILSDEGIDIADAAGRASKIAFDPADNKLIKDAYSALAKLGQKPTVRQLDDTVDALQDLLYKRRNLTAVPINGQVEGVLKSITGQINNAVKKVGGERYRVANQKFAYMIDTFEKLNKSLGAEGVRGASLMKQLFSPTGEAPRRLFSEVKKLTSIDLVEEATLAKFAMESVGDARQASLLEEVIRGQVSPDLKGFVSHAANKVIGKLKDPVGKARRIIQETPKPKP